MRDVLIIGAGGGGAVIAKELAARGLDVLLLEAGARFAQPQLEWTHYSNDANNPASGYLRFGPADRSKRPWIRELPQHSTLSQGAGVGGTTTHYYGNSPRAMPGVFSDYEGRDAAAYDTHHVFPFGYRELIPYYEWVEQTLPVQTAPMGTKEMVFLEAAGQLGLPVQTTKDTIEASYRPQENAILQPEGTAGLTADPSQLTFPTAQGCTFCGHCFQGCYLPLGAPRNLVAKRSADNSYIPMALTADLWTQGKAITLVTDAFAVQIHTDGQSVARAVTWRVNTSGEMVTEEARVIVMAGGAIETPRLWLNSGLPNPNDQVGRGLSYHVPDFVIGTMPSATNSSQGPASAARADFPGRGGLENLGGILPGNQALFLSMSDAGAAGLYDTGHPGGAQGADALGRLIGRELKAVMSDVDRVLSILILTDDDVENQNRVTLSLTAPPDEHGSIPRVEIPLRRLSARTMDNREFLVPQAVQLLRKAGAQKVYRINTPPFLFHMHSSMRMGLEPTNSVLDINAESRWVKRLFIADNSALANALGGPNPTLTTQALATRTAEKIFELYFGGTPWVLTEAPVSSIDPVVTQAVIDRQL